MREVQSTLRAERAGRRRETPHPHAAVASAPHAVLDRYYPSHDARAGFVANLFDAAAPHYDWVCWVMAFGSGQSYRRQALVRAGFTPGMRALDIATGTGLVARSAAPMLDGRGGMVGVDASLGMLRQAGKHVGMPLVQGLAEGLPFRSGSFDFASMGYALRHVADLGVAFRECLRVLKPGGRLLILEISRPRSPLGLWATRAYLRRVLPVLARLGTWSGAAATLTRYHWDTIAECVPPETIVSALQTSGLVDVEHRVIAGLMSEYVAARPPA